jgi:FMN phosphatase YigB (HAD superfamily)/DNA-binding XRE family transcriptional regulator
MNEKTLGKKLQLARKRAGMTQQELCQKAGLSYSTLAKIERGAIRSPSVFTVASIAGITGTALEDLLDLNRQSLSSPALPSKKRSKTGVTYVYLDVNGTIVRFFHKAFTDIAHAANQPTDMIETFFWRHYDPINCGQMTMEEFNAVFGGDLGLQGFDWNQYYLKNVEPVPSMKELIEWIAANYEIGIFTNSMPGAVDELRQRGFIPDINYAAIVDSSNVGLVKPDPRIYEKAQELASVEPREILLIDDTRPNLVAADKAGWQGLWSDEINPDDTIKRVKDFLAF